ncbi:AMP-binding protein [Streptomyces sp. NPDC001250]|uniref:AMP-binding protein n=1 Tax=unclassified Streptomyces TaxID=2593676 RepID=UPI00331F1FC4
MNIATLLHQAATRTPRAPAVCEGTTVLRTYAELADRARTIGTLLGRDHGARPGDRVALALRNTPAYWEILFGVWWAGLVVTPMNARLHPREFAALVTDCTAQVCVATDDLLASLGGQDLGKAHLTSVGALSAAADAAAARGHQDPAPVRPPAEVRPEDPAWLFYTSGTTGRSKGATLTHRNLMAATLSALADLGGAVDASLLHIAPMSHASGLFGLAYVARSRAQVFPRGGVVDAPTLAEGLRAFGPTAFFAVPTILRRLLDPRLLPAELIPSVHRILYGGAPMYAADLRQVIARFGPGRLWQGYGQGESPGTICHLRPEDHSGPDGPDLDRRLRSVGAARTGVEVRVVDDRGRPVPTGAVGEVAVRGDTVMAGYWNAPEATARTLGDGWLHTGDLGRLDEHGLLTLVDRAKDLIISGGSNIYPREVEEVLLRHPAVTEAAVVGAPDAEWGELPTAFVVLADGEAATEAELDGHCLALMARFKRPRRYVFAEALPKNAYGKVLKTELRGLLRQSPPDRADAPVRRRPR